MPRKDKTFSDSDVIRIYCENLTEAEQDNVDLFFYVYRPLITGVPLLFEMIEQNIRDPKMRLVIFLVRKLFDQVLKLGPKTLRKVIPNKIKKEVVKCLLERR